MHFARIVTALLFTLVALPAHASFSDVPDSHPFSEAISSLKVQGIVNGYEDGTYKPDNKINRAEFTKIIGEIVFTTDFLETCVERYGIPLSDVPLDAWFAPSICRAIQQEMVNGYPDGTYKPANNITFVEAAKIIVNAFEIPTDPTVSGAWYKPYVLALGDRKAIPTTITSLDKEITRGEMAEMMFRIMKDIQSLPSVFPETLLHTDCEPIAKSRVPNVDMETVRETWLAWINRERAIVGENQYELHPQLNRVASRWSEYSVSIGEMSHKRPGQESYYDAEILTEWFDDYDIAFAYSNGYVHTENIGRGMYSCTESDCTQQLIDATRPTFELYLSEKTLDIKPHYSSITNSEFKIIGIGITVDEDESLYYLTIHYGTEITSSPPTLCEE